MAQQLLHHLDIDTAGFEQRRKGMAEGVPANVLGDAGRDQLGRMPRCRIMSGEYGCLPFIRGLPKTQSSTSEMATVRTQAQPRSQSLSRALSVSRSPRFAAWAVWARLCWPTNMLGAPPVRKNPAVMPSMKLSVVLLRTSFGFQPNCRPSLPILLAENLLYSQKGNDALLSTRAFDVCANPYPLRLFADPLGKPHQAQRLLYRQTSLPPAFWCLTLF
jgi:hypothetical protein